jgi:hypothetical protein
MSEVKMLKGTETLASLAYTRDNDGHVKAATSKGLPGEENRATNTHANPTEVKWRTLGSDNRVASSRYRSNCCEPADVDDPDTHCWLGVNHRVGFRDAAARKAMVRDASSRPS